MDLLSPSYNRYPDILTDYLQKLRNKGSDVISMMIASIGIGLWSANYTGIVGAAIKVYEFQDTTMISWAGLLPGFKYTSC